MTVGYDPIECDEKLWNHGKDRTIVHLDLLPCDIEASYRPQVEITGDIAGSLRDLVLQLEENPEFVRDPLLRTSSSSPLKECSTAGPHRSAEQPGRRRVALLEAIWFD